MSGSKEIREDITLLAVEIDALETTVENRDDKTFTDEEYSKMDGLLKKHDQLEKNLERALKLEGIREKQAIEKAKSLKPIKGKNPKRTEEDEARDRFSLTEFVRQAKKGQLTGVYKSMHEEAEIEAKRAGVEILNFGIPSMIFGSEKRDVTTSPDTSGGNFIDEELRRTITKLEERTIVSTLGADMMTGLIGDIKWPRENSSITASFAAENATSSESNPTSDNVVLSPNRLTTFIDLSNQMMLQTSPSIDRRLTDRLLDSLARAIDIAAINGSGTSNQPEGILNTTGIGTVALGTNGGAITYAATSSLIKEVAIDNADFGATNFLTTPQVVDKMVTTIKAGSTAEFIMRDWGGRLHGFNVGISNHVPSDLTKGSGTNLSAMIYGNFNDLVVGIWGGLDVLVNPFTKGKEGLTELIATAYTDVAIMHPESFAAIVDVDTT